MEFWVPSMMEAVIVMASTSTWDLIMEMTSTRRMRNQGSRMPLNIFV